MKEEKLNALSDAEVAASREKYGANCLPEKKRKGFFRMVFENLSDPIIRILIGALVLNILFTYKNINWAECIGILAAVVIATLVSVISERGGEKAFQKMNEMAGDESVAVLRNGRLCHIPKSELVVGDIVRLSSGQRVPADAVLLTGELKVDQSALNGESGAARKRPCKGGNASPSHEGTVLSGSMILTGSGYARITAVGIDTMYGRIALELQEEGRESPMKTRLSALARVIGNIGYVAAAVVALTYLVNAFVLSSHGTAEILAKLRDLSYVGSSLVKALTVAITVIVVAVPEGLPMMLTVVLSANMKRMYKDGVLVKKPIGIETAGSMNILFCDKTGTLTTGNLTMEALFLGDLTRIASPGGLRRERSVLAHFMLQAYLNTEAFWENGIPMGGNATERAILSFAGRGRPAGVEIKSRLPFDSRYKFSAACVTGLSAPLTLYKGAPDVLLPRCSSFLSASGDVLPLTDKAPIYRKISEISRALGRVILLCESDRAPGGETPADDMTLVGIVSLRDEIRPSVPAALKQMTGAGVQTVMVTGDGRETALAIAQRVGLGDPDENAVLTSEELAKCSDRELAALLPRLRIVARALPSDKSRLVRVAQEMGLVVGMTGDGVNDAPALRAADVGFAMGSGTDVAKEAGDIVILDCDFSSIVKAVLYGRTIFRSVQKFIVFQLTMNLCAVGISLFGQLAGIRTPVTVIQMLWVNIIMDTLGGLAFAGEAPREAYMKERPKKRDESILGKKMIRKTFVMGCYTVALSTLFLYSPRLRAFYRFDDDPSGLLTAFFALFIFCGILICFTSRSDTGGIFSGLGRNKAFIFIMSLIFLVQMAMLYFGGTTFRCTPLTPSELGLAMLFAVSVLPVDLIRRFFVLLSAGKRK